MDPQHLDFVMTQFYHQEEEKTQTADINLLIFILYF